MIFTHKDNSWTNLSLLSATLQVHTVFFYDFNIEESAHSNFWLGSSCWICRCYNYDKQSNPMVILIIRHEKLISSQVEGTQILFIQNHNKNEKKIVKTNRLLPKVTAWLAEKYLLLTRLLVSVWFANCLKCPS